MKALILSFIVLTTTLSFAQEKYQEQDPKAKVILNKLSAKHKALKSFTVDFTVKLKGEGVNESISGTAYKKGTKYAYNTKGYKVVCDGKSVWTYVKDDNQVTITSADEEDEEELMSPTKLLSMWEKGFKYKHMGEVTLGGKKVQKIQLFPSNPKKHKFHTVTLYIDKAANNLVKVKIKGRDGVDMDYSLKGMVANGTIASSKFTFDASKYPGIEENDMRF